MVYSALMDDSMVHGQKMEPRNAKPECSSKTAIYTIPGLLEPLELPQLPQLSEITHEYSSTHHQANPTPAEHPKETTKMINRAFKQYVNLQLIKSCALLEISELDQALEHLEEALCIAEDKNLFYEISKCHLYRGLCFMGMERWREAKIALVRGVNVRGWEGKVEGLMREVQMHIDEDKRGRNQGA